MRIDCPHEIFWMRRKSVHHGRLVVRLVPAFSRYIFVPLSRVWEAVNYSWHVLAPVRMSDGVAKISSAALEEIRLQCSGENVIEWKEAPRFMRGERVSLHELGITAMSIFDYGMPDGKAIVLVDWMGRMTSFEVDESKIAACEVKRRERNHAGRSSSHE